MPTKPLSDNEYVLKQLKKGLLLTDFDMITNKERPMFNVRSRISQLVKRGYSIKSEWVEVRRSKRTGGNIARVKQYSLVEK